MFFASNSRRVSVSGRSPHHWAWPGPPCRKRCAGRAKRALSGHYRPELTEVVLLARLYPQKSAPVEFGRNRQPARDAQQVDRRNRRGAYVRGRQRHGLAGRCAGMR